MSTYKYKDFEVYHLVNPKLKHSYISINKQGEIKVKTPTSSKKHLENLLQEKEFWIKKQLKKIQLNQPQAVDLMQEVMLFGSVVNTDKDSIVFLHQKINKAKNRDIKYILKLHDEFYKHMATQYLVSRVAECASTMNLNYSELKFRKMKSRWGSCNSKKIITLNTQLLKLDKELIDYVIIHELSHLVHMNHSKKFHSLVEKFNPNAKENIKLLRNTILNN